MLSFYLFIFLKGVIITNYLFLLVITLNSKTALIAWCYNYLILFLVISCSQPSPIPSAYVTVVSSENGGVAILSCAEGYHAGGDDELIVCLHSALWSPTNFSCTGKLVAAYNVMVIDKAKTKAWVRSKNIRVRILTRISGSWGDKPIRGSG